MENVLTFGQLLLSELRLVVIPNNTPDNTLTDHNLMKAMTVNEELKQLGYTLTPSDIITLAKSSSLDGFMSSFTNLVGDVKAKPMYPDFPSQVMGMREGMFRFHQMMHYFSTYGQELFTGEQVSKGWLPDVKDTEKNVPDATLLDAKVIHIFVDDVDNNVYDYIYKKILSKNERITDKEKMLLLHCFTCGSCPVTPIPFKQNLLDVFSIILFTADTTSKHKLNRLRQLCQHTGDVWKCVDYALIKAKFHFRTSQKRLIVKLLELYPVNDFKANLILSNKKGRRTNLMLQYLDYNVYSRSQAHKNLVTSFRDGELKSWESKAKYLVSTKNPEALDYVCSHPGTAIRMITYLLRNGYKAQDIYTSLMGSAHKLSSQTLMSLCIHFGRTCEVWDTEQAYDEVKSVYNIVHSLLRDKLLYMKTPLMGKKLYVAMDDYNLAKSVVLTNNKSAEGGYIRSGIAYSIPKNIDRIRCFVYWNDEHRVDVDLHGSASTVDGEDVHIGWCSAYYDEPTGLVFSGDITHSNAAEYIDIDLKNTSAATVTFNMDIYSGKSCFKEIEECYVGCMAVGSIGEEVNLYEPKNCFFTHYLTGKNRSIHYGFVDVLNRCITFIGAENSGSYANMVKAHNTQYTLDKYLTDIADAQGCTVVNNPKDADVVLVMGKPSNDKEISLIDNNFFMDCK